MLEMGTETDRLSEAIAVWEVSRRGLGRSKSDFTLFKAISSGSLSSADSTAGSERIEKPNPDNLAYKLITGLFTKGGWQTFFDSHDTAMDFVVTVIGYIETTVGPIEVYGEATAIRFGRALSKWLPPRLEVRPHSVRLIASALFGEPWCAMVYDPCADSAFLAAVISATQPDFLPGRLTSCVAAEAQQLPDLMPGSLWG
jgi:hypothetical protein